MYIVLDVDKKTTWTDVRKNVCHKSTLADWHETIHGTACGMYAMYLKQFSSHGCLSWEASVETLAKQRANQPDGVAVSTTVVFVTDSGGDQDKMKNIARDAGTPNSFFVVVCFAVFTALAPLQLETLADVRRQFVRDLVLQGERSDDVLEYDRPDDTLLA